MKITELLLSESNHFNIEKCPNCGGKLVSESLVSEKKDSCYYKVKSRYKVWPSAYACVPEESSKALTRDGWKLVDELTIGEEILTYSMKKDVLEFKPILNLHRYKDAPTIVFKSGNTGFLVESTLNHKWVVKLPTPKSGRLSKYTKINDMTLMETSDILDKKNNKALVVSSIYEGGDPLKKDKIFKYGDNWIKYIIDITPEQRQSWLFSAIVYDGNQPKTQRITSKSNTTSELDWLYSGNHGKQSFGFKQKDIEHRDAFLLAAFLNGGTVTWKKNNNRNIYSCYYVSNKKYKNLGNFSKIKDDITDVWCPETENSTWVMMQETSGNGVITITGNSGALVKCRKKGAKNWGKKTEAVDSALTQVVNELTENLHKWFKEKWVRFGPDGKIRGDCARASDKEGKPKCLPQSKAHSLGKKERASAASRKRREDPNPERSGKAINVATKKK